MENTTYIACECLRTGGRNLFTAIQPYDPVFDEPTAYLMAIELQHYSDPSAQRFEILVATLSDRPIGPLDRAQIEHEAHVWAVLRGLMSTEYSKFA